MVPTAEDDDDDWIEVRRFVDPIGADMIRDFLLDHDVRVAVRGNPQATRFAWSQTSDVIRIVVPKADLEKANEALAAMTAGDSHPFRGPAPAPDEEAEGEEKFVKPRSFLSAVFLAVILPIGAGHHYARHGAAGTILSLGMVGSIFAVMIIGHIELFSAWAILLLLDLVGSFWAIRRFNEKRIPPDSVQRQWAMAAVVLAFVVAWFVAR